MRVVVHCDRCPAFVDVPSDDERFRWGVLAMRVGAADVGKVLTLCPECVRGFRLFMLGAEASDVRVAEKWESIVSGAV